MSETVQSNTGRDVHPVEEKIEKPLEKNSTILHEQLTSRIVIPPNSPLPKYFRVNLSDSSDLEYEITNIEAKDIPVEARQFMARADAAVYQVQKLVDQKRDHFKRYLREIEGYAKTALERGDIEIANIGMDTFETLFVDFEGPRLRKHYITTMLIWAVSIACVALVSTLLFQKVQTIDVLTGVAESRNHFLMPALFIIVGVSLGVTFSAFARNLELHFKTLGRFDASGLDPMARFVYCTIIAAVFSIFLKDGFLKVCVSNYCLDNEFSTNYLKCIVIGILCGFSDIIISRLLSDTMGKAATK